MDNKRLLKIAGYSDKAIKYFNGKVNVGEIKNPDAFASFLGDCGDTIEIYLRIKDSKIIDAKFVGTGCAGAFAAGSALTEMVKGKKIDKSLDYDENDINKHLGFMPKAKLHCARLVLTAFRKAIDDYYKKKLS